MLGIFLVILMYATWSSVFSLGKIALEHSPPLFLTAARMLLAGSLLLSYLAFRKPTSFRFNGKLFGLLLLLSLFSIYLTNVCEFWSLQRLSAAKTCFIYGLSPFFALLFSYLHFGERLNLRKCLGIAVGCAGFIPILSAQKGASELLTTIPFLSWPELAMVGASFCTAYGWILLRLIVNPKDPKIPATSPLMANGVSMFLGGLLALGHSALIDTWNPLPVAESHYSAVFQGVVMMTLISNILCYNLYGYLLKRFSATFLSFMGLFSPVFASLNSWLFLGEPMSPILFFSTGIVAFGLWMIYSAELRQGYTHSGPKTAENPL